MRILSSFSAQPFWLNLTTETYNFHICNNIPCIAIVCEKMFAMLSIGLI